MPIITLVQRVSCPHGHKHFIVAPTLKHPCILQMHTPHVCHIPQSSDLDDLPLFITRGPTIMGDCIGHAVFIIWAPFCVNLHCPLHCCYCGCGHDVTFISTSHKHPLGYLLVHWAWDFLSLWDYTAICHGGFINITAPHPTLMVTRGHTANVFHAYERL